jgi:hypothetical protein
MRDRRPALHAAQRKGRVSHTKRRWLADSIHVTSQLSINTCMVVYQRAPERKHLPGALYSRISLYAGHMMLVAPVAPRTASRLPSVSPPSRSDRSCSRVVITTVCVRRCECDLCGPPVSRLLLPCGSVPLTKSKRQDQAVRFSFLQLHRLASRIKIKTDVNCVIEQDLVKR